MVQGVQEGNVHLLQSDEDESSEQGLYCRSEPTQCVDLATRQHWLEMSEND